jgi:hypothetical protein
MKKLLYISFALSVILIFIAVLSYNSKTKSTTSQAVALSENEITETKLPKGRQVINEPVRNVEKQTEVTKISGNNPRSEPATFNTDETRTEKLQKKFKSLLVFHADDTMEVNKPKLAVLVLAKDANEEKMKMEVLEEADAKTDKVKTDTTIELGSKMKARLIPFSASETDFEIKPLGDDEQSFRGDRKKIIWQWKITPLKPGQHELKLSIQIIEKDGEAVSLPARNIPVVIFAKQESFMSKLGNFFSTKYEWIVSAVMIPLVIAVVNNRIKSKRHSHNPEQKV